MAVQLFRPVGQGVASNAPPGSDAAIDIEFDDTPGCQKSTLNSATIDGPIKRVLNQSRAVDLSDLSRAPHQIGPL